jgi:hypothetical protein
VKIARFSLAALAALAFLLVVNVVFFPFVFPDGSPDHFRFMRAEPIAAYNFLAMLIASVLLAYVFPIGYRGRTPWAEGLRFGMLMGGLTTLPMSLHVYATAEVNFTGLLTTVLWTVITWGVAGGIIGAIYGKTLEAE